LAADRSKIIYTLTDEAPYLATHSFLPIVRTYIPFVAGLGAMEPARFTMFNVVGAVLWVGSLCYAGFFFGNIPWIKGNLTLIIVGIIVVSLVPVVWAWVKSRKGA